MLHDYTQSRTSAFDFSKVLFHLITITLIIIIYWKPQKKKRKEKREGRLKKTRERKERNKKRREENNELKKNNEVKTYINSEIIVIIKIRTVHIYFWRYFEKGLLTDVSYSAIFYVAIC